MAHFPEHRARIARRAEAGGGLVRVVLNPSATARASYARAGQYVSVTSEGVEPPARPGFFVLAGDVGAPTWELVIRPGSEVANRVLGVADGAFVLTSTALGAGFPIDEAKGRALLLAATGSGIAAMRPVITHRLAERDGRRTDLLLGVRTLSDVPLPNELLAWRARGLNIVVCLSREEAPAHEIGYLRGYVQDAARLVAADEAHRGGMIFAAGVKPMIEAIRALSQELGISESDVRTNY